MKKNTRNIYPGGNTPYGFYSYYNYILMQKEAKKIFCIKGGPGSGKSTLMRYIGEYFSDKGENVDFFWCSSDPSSLDGILLKDRKTAMIDGTAPHVIDPVNPGAVDEIINMGEFWDEKGIRKNRNDILKCGENISGLFDYAYGYLKCARQYHIFMSQIIDKYITGDELREYESQIGLKLDSVSLLKRAESRKKKDMALGRKGSAGNVRKFFASAITPEGVISHIDSIIKDMEKVIVIEAPLGFRTERLLSPVSERLRGAGFEVEEYYCPLFPDEKTEHIVCPEARLAITCSNDYHTVADEKVDGKVMKVRIGCEECIRDKTTEKILKYVKKAGHENILNAVEMLKSAKEQHDILESYYIPNMDFDRIEKFKKIIADRIESEN